MSNTFQDKVVIVTGGSSGIGQAVLNAFLEAGAKVASLDIRPPADTISAQTNRLDVTCDVSSEASAEAAVAKVIEKWGTLDVLCNVAGVMDAMARVSEAETSTWERCFQVNVNGPFYLTRAATNHFLTKPFTDKPSPLPPSDTDTDTDTPMHVTGLPFTRGSIVNVCSTASKSGCHAGVAYTASKHAVLGLSRNTAWMYAKDGIRCNAVLPGGVPTNIMQNSGQHADQIQRARGMAAVWPVNALMPGYVNAKDVARAVLFVAGTEGVNGAEVSVDGGWTTI